jgi:gliding motility associated protien GldN
MKKRALTIIFILLGSLTVLAQNKNIFDPDSVLKKTLPKDSVLSDSAKTSALLLKARPFPLPEPNIKEIRFYHRYWRDIDLQDKKNLIFSKPGASLIEAMLKGIKDGKIKAYDPMGGTPENPAGDAFITAMSYNDLMSHLSDTAYVDQFDKDGNKTGSIAKPNPFTPDKIAGFRIKEDVFYDKQRSKIITRIIGIAPLLKLSLSSGDSLGIQPLCWIKFKECRKVLVTIDEDTPNKKIGLTMDDIFLQRRFNAKIVEESNPLGSRIKDYETSAADQQKEAIRIEDKLTTFKKTMFTYALSAENELPNNQSTPVKRTKVKDPQAATSNTPSSKTGN